MIRIVTVSLLSQTPQILYQAEKKTRLYYHGPLLGLGGDNTVSTSSPFPTSDIFPSANSTLEMDEGDVLWCYSGSSFPSTAYLFVID